MGGEGTLVAGGQRGRLRGSAHTRGAATGWGKLRDTHTARAAESQPDRAGGHDGKMASVSGHNATVNGNGNSPESPDKQLQSMYQVHIVSFVFHSFYTDPLGKFVILAGRP